MPISAAGMRSRREVLGLYARTIRHLSPQQLAYRLKLRTQRVIDPWLIPLRERASAATTADPPGWPADFTPLERSLASGFPTVDEDGTARFRFLEAEANVALTGPYAWEAPDETQLWRFHLHYWEWAWAFQASANRIDRLDDLRSFWRSWRAAAAVGKGDAWSPYVVSLRTWVLCDLGRVLAEGTRERGEFHSDLVRHHRFLRSHLELDVGGNHLIKNLKGLIASSVYLGDERSLHRACARLEWQLAVQVLADGGHYELSPSYHCQVLGDLIDVQQLLAKAGCPPVPELSLVIARMRRWLSVMLMPDGDVPLFNDAVKVGTERVSALEPSLEANPPLTVLAESGYVVMRPDERAVVVMDVGHPCPDELPAHAHADCLSFEMWVDGVQVVADTGVSEYRSGRRRSFERSTRAHNTVEIAGQDQTEVWGAFRAARRARPRVHSAELEGATTRVVASHDGYQRLAAPADHTRTLTVEPGRLSIRDDLVGGPNRATVRVHLLGLDIADTGSEVDAARVGPVELFCDHRMALKPCQVATSFGRLGPAVEVSVPVQVPIRVSMEFRW